MLVNDEDMKIGELVVARRRQRELVAWAMLWLRSSQRVSGGRCSNLAATTQWW
jgi:hypothetical protein